MTAPITILGAGIVGLSVATELHTRGIPVRVYDPAPAPGPHGCSWWAGGMLAPFCEGESAEEPVVRLGQLAADWCARHGVDVVHNGSVAVALSRDAQELDRFARRTERHETLDRTALSQIEPHLADRFDRALFFRDEAHINPRQMLTHLRTQLENGGVEFVSEAGTPHGQTIDCRGLAARDALPDLRGVKGEMVILNAPDVTLSRPVRLLHPRYPLYIVPRGDGHYMLGATQLESEDRNRVTVRSVLELLSAAYALHPGFGEADLVEIGTDARPAFADNLPRIRRIGDVTHVNGLFRHGYLLTPALAQMVGDLICDGKTPEDFYEDHG